MTDPVVPPSFDQPPVQPPDQPSDRPLNRSAVTTYRYLRLAMVALVVLLAASVVVEWLSTDPRCLLPSISDYYYTPAKAVFVGTLIAIGVCLVALKGNTEQEDILLNLAGMLAPVVAVVPIPRTGECRSVDVPLRDTAADIGNNMTALFFAGLVALVVAVVLAVRARLVGTATWDHRHWMGLLVAALALAAALTWFLVDRSSFDAGAHYTAAVAMFGCIVVVVVINARGYGRQQPGNPGVHANRYSVIAVLMIAITTILLGLWLAGWDHAIFWLEGSLITLFACFWVLQTQELWRQGLRRTSR